VALKKFVNAKHLARLLNVTEHSLRAHRLREPAAVLLIAGNRTRILYEVEPGDLAVYAKAVEAEVVA
jgi:hypothetical protein